MNGPHVIIMQTAAEVADAAAALIDEWIDQDLRDTPDTHVALAGGSTPAATYRAAVTKRRDWDGVHMWLGDERLVAPDHADANVAMIRRELVGPAGVPEGQFHIPDTGMQVDAAAEAYGARITRALPEGPHHIPRFSIVILGVGEDAHIASLFPNAPALAAATVCVGVWDAPKPPPERISLSLPVINAASRRLIIATGAAKSPAVRAALGEPDPASPASMLEPANTTMIVDRAAAQSIS